MKKSLPALIAVALLLIIWEISAWMIGRPEIFPTVFRLLATLGKLLVSVPFYQSIGATILRGMAGILLSLVAACGFSVLSARYRWLYDAFRPILAIMRSIPVVSFILLALIYLHPESIPLLIAFLVMFPLLAENSTKGILGLHPGYKAMAQVFLIKGKNRVFQVYYPQLKPFLFSGLASAMGFGWRAIIMGEVLSQCALGIGSEMKRAQVFIDVPELMAWTIVAILISFVSDKAIRRLEQKDIPLSWPSRTQNRATAEGMVYVNDISFSYPGKQVFSHFSYVFNAHTIYGISAPSGAGKTTLLHLINGIQLPAEGDIRINRQSGIATVFQEPELLPHLSVLENILLPLTACTTKEEATQVALQIITVLDIDALADKKPGELSYGQQQRAAIARALVYPSPLLLMDEPFKGFEAPLVQKIIRFIRQRQQQRKQTIIFTTHNPDELRLLADDVIHL